MKKSSGFRRFLPVTATALVLIALAVAACGSWDSVSAEDSSS
jgi:hypothetical protein